MMLMRVKRLGSGAGQTTACCSHLSGEALVAWLEDWSFERAMVKTSMLKTCTVKHLLFQFC